jgi:hypothetical protein
MIDRWILAQIAEWPQGACFGCRKPILPGQKWVDLVRDNCRARFHRDCEPAWRAALEPIARRTLGIS